jgi:predicted secreted hydrolase
MRCPRIRFLSLVFFLAVFLGIRAAYAAMPAPAGNQVYSYPPTGDPLVSPEPSEARPMGVGPIAVGGNVLDFAVDLGPFQAPVDIYLALYAPALGSSSFYLLTGQNRLQPLSSGFEPWKSGVQQVSEMPFGNLSFSQLPSGRYTFYLAVTEPGSLDHFYLWDTYVDVEGGQIFLPRDDAVHANPVEWWYWTGHLTDSSGCEYGFEEVFFLLNLTGSNYVMAHHAITDICSGTYTYDVRIGRGSVENIQNGFLLVSGNWSAFGGDGHDALHGEVGSYAMDLDLISEKPPVLHFGDGYEAFDFGGFTYYYSRPRMSAKGTLAVNGEALPVTGSAWFDHQWGDLFKAVELGWEWFGIQLDDGKEIMLFVFKGVDGEPVLAGTIEDADGNAQELKSSEFAIAPLGEWTSPVTECTYPSGWAISVAGLSLTVTPVVDDQEIPYPITYWEGDATVTGDMSGQAYVELSRYCQTPITLSPPN